MPSEHRSVNVRTVGAEHPERSERSNVDLRVYTAVFLILGEQKGAAKWELAHSEPKI